MLNKPTFLTLINRFIVSVFIPIRFLLVLNQDTSVWDRYDYLMSMINIFLIVFSREMDKRLFYKAAPRKRPKLLSDKMRRTFDQKQLTCCEYEGVTPEQEREIFQVRHRFFDFTHLPHAETYPQ